MSEHVALLPEIEQLEREGRFDEAFQRMALRNQRDLAGLDLDEQAAEESLRYERYAATYPTGIFERASVGNGSRAPIFIVGIPRCGSTLIEQILSTHSEVVGLDETLVFGTVLANDINWLRPDATSSGELRRVSARYLRLMRERGWRKTRRFVDKSLGNFELVGNIHLLFPSATILHAVRDPIDTCFACFRTPFRLTPATRFTRELSHIGAHYVRYRRLMDHWLNVLPPGRVIQVRHEDLVCDVEAGARRVVEACGLVWEEACLRFYENPRPAMTASKDQVRRPIFTESLGRWRHYRRHLGPLLEALGPYAPGEAAAA